MIGRRHFMEFLGASALAPAFAAAARAQAKWPTRFVRLVVPFPPGGGTDAIARVVAIKLSTIWGHEMVIENKGGGATSIGTDAVAKAEPDGHTVLLQSVPLAVNKYLFASLPFDPVADLAPVTLICDYPNVMAVPMSSPAHSVQEFIAYARANPGKATYASSGHGTSVHLSGELFNKMTGLKLQHIPYRGAGPALNDLIPGRVDVMFNNIGSVVPFIKGGKLRALGVAASAPLAALPEVPTIAAAAGLPGFEAVSWYALMAPAGTPREVISKIHGDVAKALQMADVRERLAGMGAEPSGESPAELAARIKAEYDRWGAVVRKANIKAD
jgi:tripartite-type tricarboxylate transporter receptor subunit TctC